MVMAIPSNLGGWGGGGGGVRGAGRVGGRRKGARASGGAKKNEVGNRGNRQEGGGGWWRGREGLQERGVREQGREEWVAETGDRLKMSTRAGRGVTFRAQEM